MSWYIGMMIGSRDQQRIASEILRRWNREADYMCVPVTRPS